MTMPVYSRRSELYLSRTWAQLLAFANVRILPAPKREDPEPSLVFFR